MTPSIPLLVGKGVGTLPTTNSRPGGHRALGSSPEKVSLVSGRNCAPSFTPSNGRKSTCCVPPLLKPRRRVSFLVAFHFPEWTPTTSGFASMSTPSCVAGWSLPRMRSLRCELSATDRPFGSPEVVGLWRDRRRVSLCETFAPDIFPGLFVRSGDGKGLRPYYLLALQRP